MAVDFSRFREKLSAADIQKMEDQYKAGGTRSDVPSGTYPVQLSRMEVKDNNFGGENMNISFKITDGDRKGQLIFYNGSFNNKIDSGFRATARLISEMTGGDLDEDSVLFNITKEDHDAVADYIEAVGDLLKGAYEWDLKYEVVEQTKINPNTGKPYGPNRFFSITDVYDI
jgi:hypothetical protein